MTIKKIRYELQNGMTLITVSIDELDAETIDNLDENLVSICEGDSRSAVDDVKISLCNLFQTKNKNFAIGAVAELFIHLIVRGEGFKQECLFRNLEEKSIKKGFDGVYTLNAKETWLMESKAGEGVDCVSKVFEANRDLTSKINGNSSNNAWRNAFYHASLIDVGTDKDVRESIRKLSCDYEKSIYHSISEFNIIPCGTDFNEIIDIESEWKERIIKDKGKFLGRNVMIICIKSCVLNEFLGYLGVTLNEE